MKNVRVCIKEVDLATSPADEVCAVKCITACLWSCCPKLQVHGGTTIAMTIFFLSLLLNIFICYVVDEVTGKQVAVGTGEFEDLKCG